MWGKKSFDISKQKQKDTKLCFNLAFKTPNYYKNNLKIK